ncbi:MAG: NYN domain-containing protein [Actinomycetota bacterium]|nr:NYN domain-containing protein [Actinomycetota bacterium]
MATVLVDARNVLRSEWPNIPEHELVALCRRWAAEKGRRVVVVFDREAPGGLVGRRTLDEACELVGTGEESADDWLRRAARDCSAHERPYWLVTSDRELRASAGTRAERVVGGGAFARALRSAS